VEEEVEGEVEEVILQVQGKILMDLLAHQDLLNLPVLVHPTDHPIDLLIRGEVLYIFMEAGCRGLEDGMIMDGIITMI